MPAMEFDQVILGVLTSVRIVLRRIFASTASETMVLFRAESRSVMEERENLRLIIGVFCTQQAFADIAQPSLCSELVQLLQQIPNLTQEEIPGEMLVSSADTVRRIAEHFEALSYDDMAYNLAEYSYHLSDLVRHRCLDTARALRRLADRENLDQHYSALWRYATQIVLAAIDDASLRIEAIDASELAWTVYAPTEVLQKKLCDDFFSVLHLIGGTPIETLAMAYPVEVDARFISPEMRRKCIALLSEKNLPSDASETLKQAAYILAVFKAQATLDDARQELIGLSSEMPSVSWNNLLLRHGKLVNAVPLQRSLIVDVSRTGDFAMQLAHELTHAYCLIGPIGWSNAAFRSAMRIIELALERFGATSEQVNLDLLSRIFAESQLSAGMREAEQESAWTPWLEGVAQYLELLADPTENEKQIITVHAALRSLVEPETKDGVSVRESFDRMAQEFDLFLSQSIRRLSYPRHRSYTHPSVGSLRYSYFLGYLMVRGVVARWEATLGRRIPPVDAAKILVLVTQGATECVDWGMHPSEQDSAMHASNEFERWLDLVLSMSRESLELILTSPDKDSSGQPYYWEAGKPFRMSEPPTSHEIDCAMRPWTKIIKEVTSLLSTPGMFEDLHEEEMNEIHSLLEAMAEPLRNMLYKSVESRALLPVGREMARILLMENGRIGVCPRTYVGLAKPSDSAGFPRYSLRSFVLEGDATKFEELRKALGRDETARVLVTRVVDLIGDPKSPAKQSATSYVCMFLGKNWHRVTFGDNMNPMDISPEFLRAISQRLNEGMAAGSKSSHIDSLKKLASRLLKTDPSSTAALLANSFDSSAKSRDTAIRVLSRQWNVEPHRLLEAVDTIFADIASRDLMAKYLYQTGTGIAGAELPDSFPLKPIAFQRRHLSGIKPLGEQQ